MERPHTLSLSLPILLKEAREKRNERPQRSLYVAFKLLSYPFYCREVGEERKKVKVRNDTEQKRGKKRWEKEEKEPNQTKPNLLKAEGPMVTNTAKSNIKYTEKKTKQYKLWKIKNKKLEKETQVI